MRLHNLAGLAEVWDVDPYMQAMTDAEKVAEFRKRLANLSDVYKNQLGSPTYVSWSQRIVDVITALESKIAAGKISDAATTVLVRGSSAPGDIQAQINTLQGRLAELNKKLDTSGSTDPTIVNTNNAITSAANAISSQINDLAVKLNTINEQKSKAEALQAASPAGIAAANKAAADALKQQLFFLKQPGYDYGVGSNRRNVEYKGLGTSMNGKTSPTLFNLHRQDGLGDFFSDVLAGAKAAVASERASGTLPGLPKISLPGLPSVSAPSWLSAMANAAKAGVSAARSNKSSAPLPASSAPNIATGGAEQTTTISRPFNYLGWGAAIASLGVAWVVLRRRR